MFTTPQIKGTCFKQLFLKLVPPPQPKQMPFINIPVGGVPTLKKCRPGGPCYHQDIEPKKNISCSPLRKSKEPVSSNFFQNWYPPPQPKQMPFINIPGGYQFWKMQRPGGPCYYQDIEPKKIFHVHHSANQKNCFKQLFQNWYPPPQPKQMPFIDIPGGYQLWKCRQVDLLPPGHWT